MNFLLLFFLVFSFSAQGKVDGFELRNLQIDFQNDVGKMQADLVNIDFDFGKLDLVHYNFSIKRNDGDLILEKYDDTLFVIRDVDDSILKGVKVFRAQQVETLGISNKRFEFKTKKFELAFGEESNTLDELEILCEGRERDDPTWISFLKPCFDKGELKAPALSLNVEKNQKVATFLETYIDEKISTKGINPKVKNIDFQITKNKFDLNFDIRFLFKWPFHIWGTGKYDKEESLIIFDIEKAKLGIIPITKMVLNFIAKEKIENLEVKGSKIIIKVYP